MLTSSTIQETAGTQANGTRANDTKKDQSSLLQTLITESQNEASQGFDTKSALEIARIINHEDSKIAAAVKKAIPEIAAVIDQVARSLRAALANQGFQAGDLSPSVVLTYHWGVLRVDRRQIRVPYGIKSNLEARIELVSTHQLGAEVENHILLREKSGQTNEDAASTRILGGPATTVAENARQPRIFAIASSSDMPWIGVPSMAAM